MVAGFARFLSAEAPVRAAQEEPEPIRLEYLAGEGCPSVDEFAARVRARTTLMRPAWPGEKSRAFRIDLDAGPPALGQLTIRDADQAAGSRTVHADTCAKAADALSLVVALAVDARLVAPPAAEQPDATGSAGMPASVPVAPPPGPIDAASTSPEAIPPQAMGGHGAGPHAFFVGADLVLATGVTPDALVSASPYIGWRAARSTWDASLRLSFVRSQSGLVDIGGVGQATFTWTVGRLDTCAAPWPRWVVGISACARVEAGAFEATGADIAAPQTKLRGWFAAGPLARLEWSFALDFFFDADLGLLFRATNDRFIFLPEVTVDQVPVVGVVTGAGLGVRFL